MQRNCLKYTGVWVEVFQEKRIMFFVYHIHSQSHSSIHLRLIATIYTKVRIIKVGFVFFLR
ncbi:Uncharacterized protein APZ42_004906 [Daphnia magna]|uniref:Uncharacterized protein n=1 Tax=Daphnia magna TaxID=35525 RepID=A0A164GRY9_9CRUS|nr:Uncharacterized protein APZ42_004906 [Daphnia magna]